jgi:hypothetical protein
MQSPFGPLRLLLLLALEIEKTINREQEHDYENRIGAAKKRVA